MNAYSSDLSKKIVAAKENGARPPLRSPGPSAWASRASRALRCHRTRRKATRSEGAPRLQTQARRSGKEATGGGPRRAPCGDAAQRREFLRRTVGVELSDSTLSRMLKRLGWSRKKDRWVPQSARSS